MNRKTKMIRMPYVFFEKKWEDAIKNKTHYIPASDFIFLNSNRIFHKNSELKILKLKIIIHYVFFGKIFDIKKDFVFHGVSTGVFRIFFKKFDQRILPAILFYECFYSKFCQMQKDVVHIYFLITLKYCKINFFKRNLFYWIVIFLDWLSCNKNKNNV